MVVVVEVDVRPNISASNHPSVATQPSRPFEALLPLLSFVTHSLSQSVGQAGPLIKYTFCGSHSSCPANPHHQGKNVDWESGDTRGERSMQSNEFADSHSTGSFQSKHTPAQQTERQTERTMSLIGHLDVNDRHDGLQQIQFLVLQRATPLVVVFLDEHVAR